MFLGPGGVRTGDGFWEIVLVNIQASFSRLVWEGRVVGLHPAEQRSVTKYGVFWELSEDVCEVFVLL